MVELKISYINPFFTIRSPYLLEPNQHASLNPLVNTRDRKELLLFPGGTLPPQIAVLKGPFAVRKCVVIGLLHIALSERSWAQYFRRRGNLYTVGEYVE
jgi:hypothetical protein